MPHHHSILTYRASPKRTYNEESRGQIGQPGQPYSNRRIQAPQPTAFAPHPTVLVNRSGRSSSIINSAISNNKAGWRKWKRGSNNKININATTNTNINTNTSTSTDTDTDTSKNNDLPLSHAREYEERTSNDTSPQVQEHKKQTAFQKPADRRENKVIINKGSDVTMDDSPSAQVPAFFHLLLLESLGAPGSELKDEYVRERRRLAKLYGLQLSQSEGEVAMEYMENRTKGMEAEAGRRVQVNENNGRSGYRRR